MSRARLWGLGLALWLAACPKPAPPLTTPTAQETPREAPRYTLSSLSEGRRATYREALAQVASPCEVPETLLDATQAARCPEAIYLARISFRALRDGDPSALDISEYLGQFETARQQLAKAPTQIDLSRAPSRGPDNATIQLVEFADFQCPHCAHLHEELSALRGSLDQYARFYFKNFPLSSHTLAEPAARAALAAHQQGKFWPYFDLLFTRQEKIDADKFSEWAKELGLDVQRFEADFQSAALSQQVAGDRAEALALGFTGTPVLFINQQPHLDRMTREAIWDAVVFLLAEQGAAPLPEPPR